MRGERCEMRCGCRRALAELGEGERNKNKQNNNKKAAGRPGEEEEEDERGQTGGP